MADNSEFGKKLRELRLKKDLTRQQLADMMYVSPPTISRWETGDRLPDLTTLARLADCLGVHPYELLENAGEPNQKPLLIVVEDELILLSACVRIVSKALPQAEVKGFQKASEAVSFASSNDVDLAFLDIELRGANGIELAGQLQSCRRRTNIVFLTSHAEYMDEAWKLHASGFLLKPITTDKLQEELKNLRYPVRGLSI